MERLDKSVFLFRVTGLERPADAVRRGDAQPRPLGRHSATSADGFLDTIPTGGVPEAAASGGSSGAASGSR